MSVKANPCDGCGLCCSQLIVEIDHIDVVREPRLESVADLMDGNGSIQFESVWHQEYMLTACKPCPMLDDDKRCSIYPSRPNCCVAFEVGSDKCNELRERAGLEAIDARTS